MTSTGCRSMQIAAIQRKGVQAASTKLTALIPIEVSKIAMRVGGGKSYNKQNGLERLLRDAYASQVMAPSVDVLSIWLGKAITGQNIP